jgi:hypothetical protein
VLRTATDLRHARMQAYIILQMTDYKQRSFAQRVGTAGEVQFRGMAVRQHLTATKVEEDFGVDFVCQAEETITHKSANPMIPAQFGVCVRASETADGRVRLDRKDAGNMLRFRQPLVFVLVHLVADPAPCYYRVIDADFGQRLSLFLLSGNDEMSLTPADCHPEAAFRRDLLPALRSSAVRRTQLALAEMRLETLVPGATVEMHLDRNQEIAIIIADDYFDFFEQLPEEQRSSVYRAAFGRPDLFDIRSTQFPFKYAIPEALVDAPEHMVVAGGVVNENTILEVSGADGTAEAEFTYTRIGTHYGWVHPDGLALTVSKPKPAPDGTLVHETRVLIDDEADRTLDDLSDDLRGLLHVAVPDAVLRDTNGSFTMEVDYFQLPRLCEVVRAHADARRLSGWDPIAMQLRDVNDPISRFAIMMLGTWAVDPALFPKLGLYIDFVNDPIDLAKAERKETDGLVTVVLDTARATILATVSGFATELWLDGHMIGLAAFDVQQVEIEVGELIERDETYPEIVLGPRISLVLDPSGARFSDTPFWLDGLGYRTPEEQI